MKKTTTRQGLRNLDYIQAAPKGRKLELPENQFIDCPHTRKDHDHGFITCLDCGEDLPGPAR